jgi:hypothetical protein
MYTLPPLTLQGTQTRCHLSPSRANVPKCRYQTASSWKTDTRVMPTASQTSWSCPTLCFLSMNVAVLVLRSTLQDVFSLLVPCLAQCSIRVRCTLRTSIIVIAWGSKQIIPRRKYLMFSLENWSIQDVLIIAVSCGVLSGKLNKLGFIINNWFIYRNWQFFRLIAHFSDILMKNKIIYFLVITKFRTVTDTEICEPSGVL